MGTRKGVAGYWNGRNGPEAYPTKKIKPKKKKKKNLAVKKQAVHI